MNGLLRLLPALLIALALLLLVGCKKEEDETPRPAVGEVSVSVGEDSLCLIPGDTVTTAVTVVVMNTHNLPMAGVHVNVSLSDTEWVTLELVNPALGDTTDPNGRIEYIYTPSWPSMNWIRAEAVGLMDSASIVSFESAGDPPGFALAVMTDTIALSPPDSAEVMVHLQNSFGMPIAGITLAMTTSGGTLDPIAPTDSNGNAFTYWHPTEVGHFLISASYQWIDLCHDMTLTAADSVTVLPRPLVGRVRILAADTLRMVPGDSASTPVTVIVTDRQGRVTPNRVISISLTNASLGFLEPINPAGGDTTDALGRVQFLYTAFEAGIQTIIAACEGVIGVDSIVTEWDAWNISLEEVSTLYVPNDTIDVHLYDPNGELAIGLPLTFRAEFDSNQVTHNAQTTSSSWGCNPPLLYWGDGNDDPDNPVETIHAFYIASQETLAHAYRAYAVRPR